jgi:hypothetical protein
MDRILRIYTKTDHLFAEFIFSYDGSQQLYINYTGYRQLYADDEPESEGKAVYPMDYMDYHESYREFASIEEIKVWDKAHIKTRFREDLSSYKFVYEPETILYRYVCTTHRNVPGIINIRANFIENKKELELISGIRPYDDCVLSSDSLTGNFNLIELIPDDSIRYSDRTKIAPEGPRRR